MRFFCLSLGLCCFFAMPSLLASGVEGLWTTSKGDAVFEIAEKAGVVNGRLVWVKDRAGVAGAKLKDVHNPDPKKRRDFLRGQFLMKGFKAVPGRPREWSGGTIYDPETGKTYQARLRLKDDATMELRGYIGIPALGRSDVWKRVEKLPGS